MSAAPPRPSIPATTPYIDVADNGGGIDNDVDVFTPCTPPKAVVSA